MSGNENDSNDAMSEEDVAVVEPMIVESSASGRKRNLTSNVWDEFGLKTVNEKEKATCKSCGKVYAYDSKKGGTSNLNRHIKKCTKIKMHNVGQMMLDQTNENGILGTRNQKLDQMAFRDSIAMLITACNLPFNFVVRPEFRNLCSLLNMDAKHISRNTAKADILKIHKKQKELIRARLVSAPGKISFTSDLWTSINTDGYICLTAHFVDSDWVLQKLVLNFSHLPPPHTGRAIADKIFSMLTDWGIEDKVFSITLDNAASNDRCVEVMKDRLCLKEVLYSNGEYFHVRCCAHILNLIVREGLKTVNVPVDKIRDSVKYLKGSQVRKTKFLDTVQQLGIKEKKGLRQDVPTRWNSTYIMLDSCLAYEKVFSHLKLIDDNYENCPTPTEWKQIAATSNFLKAFYEVTNLFSGSKYPTSNLYFDGIWNIQMILEKGSNSSDVFIRQMAIEMITKFDKYWSEYSPILAMALVLDPRYKLQFVEYSYKKLYTDSLAKENVKDVRNRMERLYCEYRSSKSRASTNSTMENIGTSVVGNSTPNGVVLKPHLEEFAAEQNQSDTIQNMTELEIYLQEARLPIHQELDVLEYWKGQVFRFSDLTRMARDILTIPVSTVASESAFSIGGKILDQYRSSLKPENVEALVTTRDWFCGMGVDYMELKANEIVEDVLEVGCPSVDIA